MIKVATPVVPLVHAPTTDKTGGGTGVFVGVLVGSGVFVGVGVGRLEHEPTTLNVTEERKEVLYVTVMVAYPAPLIEVNCPGGRLSEPL